MDIEKSITLNGANEISLDNLKNILLNCKSLLSQPHPQDTRGKWVTEYGEPKHVLVECQDNEPKKFIVTYVRPVTHEEKKAEFLPTETYYLEHLMRLI